MAVVNVLDVSTTKRLSTMLLAAGGALTFAAFNLVAAGVSAENEQFAAEVSGCFEPLIYCLASGLVSFVMAQLAEHPELPASGSRWSRRNLLETAFAFITVGGLVFLVWATTCLFSAATIKPG